MSWEPITVNSWEAFSKTASQLSTSATTSAYLFRGQSVAEWSLKPSLLRLLPENISSGDALSVERFGRDEFASQAHLHLHTGSLPTPHPEPSICEWWALMQHHGAPTRLLDWTLSPYVAAYFSVEQQWNKDGAVCTVHSHASSIPFIKKHPGGVSNEQLTDRSIEPSLIVWAPSKKTARIVAQQGQFTVCTNVLGDHGTLLDVACSEMKAAMPAKLFHQKLVIPSALKPAFLKQLRTMGIAAHSLFPGVDGLGRSISEIARLGSPPPTAA